MNSCIYSSIRGLGKILSVFFFHELLFPIGRIFKQQTDAGLFLAAVTSSDKTHSGAKLDATFSLAGFNLASAEASIKWPPDDSRNVKHIPREVFGALSSFIWWGCSPSQPSTLIRMRRFCMVSCFRCSNVRCGWISCTFLTCVCFFTCIRCVCDSSSSHLQWVLFYLSSFSLKCAEITLNASPLLRYDSAQDVVLCAH